MFKQIYFPVADIGPGHSAFSSAFSTARSPHENSSPGMILHSSGTLVICTKLLEKKKQIMMVIERDFQISEHHLYVLKWREKGGNNDQTIVLGV